MLKYYLRGLGIGIAVTALILTVFYHTKGKMSNSEIKEQASKLGMVMAPTTEAPLFNKPNPDDGESDTSDEDESGENTSGENDSEGNTETEETEKPTEKETETEKPTEKETETEKPTEKETETEKPTEKETETEEETEEQPPKPQAITASIEIRSGMFSEAVSRLLEEAGIISNAAEFNMYLENNGYSERICVGTFTVSSDMSYEQLARIITRS